jgi:hypothetical protein
VLFFISHVTSIAALALYTPVLHHSDYILGSGPDTGLLIGAFLEVVLVLAIVGTGVAVFPIVKRQNEAVALGYAGLRTLEAGVIATMRPGTADAVTLGSALVSFHNWTFLIGPSFICGTNTVLLAYLLHRSGLVPRFIAVLGLIGGPLVFASGTAQLFDLYGQFSGWAPLAAVPVSAWELCLAFYLVAKGFRPSDAPHATTDPVPLPFRG